MILVTHLPAAAGSGVGVGSNNPDTRNPYVFNSVLTLNNPSDTSSETYELATIAVTDQFSLATEPLPGSDGMQSYIPNKIRKVLHFEGVIRSATLAGLNYKAMQLIRYFDPINAFWDDSASTMADNKGFLPLAFSVPTSDTATYATGLISVIAYVRAIARPIIATSVPLIESYNAKFRLILEMIDPRFYEASSQTVALNNGTTTAHTSKTEYPTFPVITLAVSGAPSSSTIIRRNLPLDENGSTIDCRLDLTKTQLGAAATVGDTVTIDMATGAVALNGTDRPDFLVSGYVKFWPVLPGSNQFFFSGTNMTGSLAYTRAYA